MLWCYSRLGENESISQLHVAIGMLLVLSHSGSGPMSCQSTITSFRLGSRHEFQLRTIFPPLLLKFFQTFREQTCSSLVVDQNLWRENHS